MEHFADQGFASMSKVMDLAPSKFDKDLHAAAEAQDKMHGAATTPASSTLHVVNKALPSAALPSSLES
jgi:hypothetical protein